MPIVRILSVAPWTSLVEKSRGRNVKTKLAGGFNPSETY